MLEYIRSHYLWSRGVFGHGDRTTGLLKHLRKECDEVDADRMSLEERVDCLIISLDLCLQTGATPEEVYSALVEKQAKNASRTWPEQKTLDEPIEHVEETNA